MIISHHSLRKNCHKTMIDLLVKLSNWKFILPAFLGTLLSVFLFINGMEKMSSIAREKMELLDARKSYTLEEVNVFFTKLTAEGRAVHQQLTGVIDMLFPLIFGALSILLLAFLIKNIFGTHSKLLYLALYPIIGMTIDYMENFNTLALLAAFPDLTTAMVEKGSQLTALKHQLGFFRFAAIFGLGGVWLFNLIRRRLR